LPYKRSFRDKLSNYPLLKPLQKALTLKELIFSNWNIKSLPFSNFYSHSKQLLQDNSEIKIVIASGRPFQAFSIGHQLKKDFPNIHWIPDYRDKWTTNEALLPSNILEKLVLNLDKKSELKWTSNSSFFITVSDNWRESVSKLINKPGTVSANGFDKELSVNTSCSTTENGLLNLLYMGSLYGNQCFSILFNSINEINDSSSSQKIHITFLGSYSNKEGLKSLKKTTEVLGDNVTLKDKVSHERVAEYLETSDVLLLTSIQNLKGILPVKIYDYYNSNKPILLCPSDNDLMEKFIKETEYIANSKEECKETLQDLLQKKQAGTALIGPRNTKNAYFYKRKHQTKLF
jgi:hypothetical protein